MYNDQRGAVSRSCISLETPEPIITFISIWARIKDAVVIYSLVSGDFLEPKRALNLPNWVLYTPSGWMFVLRVGGVHAGADWVAAAALQPQPGLSWPHCCKAPWDTARAGWPVQFPSGISAPAESPNFQRCRGFLQLNDKGSEWVRFSKASFNESKESTPAVSKYLKWS